MPAKVYRAPEPFKPDYTAPVKDYIAAETAYVEGLAKQARDLHPGDALAGEILRWQRADGYAQYMVWKSKGGLELIWLETGDAWSVEPALIRGLRLADVKAMVKRDKALAALFSRKSA